jgi:hydroxymethylpyrimidine pyrophosphatase-like HAD family hydrolase
MKKSGIIFTDVDGSLCFHEKIHKLKPVTKTKNNQCRVLDTYSGKTYDAYDVSVSSYNIFFTKQTQQLLTELSKQYEIVPVTGGRPSTAKKRHMYLSFSDAVILENGGVIIEKNGSICKDWHEQLEPQRKQLPLIRKELISQGWVNDDKGGTSAIRIRLKDNPEKTQSEFNDLCSSIALPEGLKKTVNLSNLDIILKGAGKDNAVRFWLNRRGYSTSESIGIGDDINDMEFLQITGKPYVLASSYPQLLKKAEKQNWYITKKPTVEGIHEILTQLIKK